MRVHIFGAVSSPSCDTFALLKTADDNQKDYPSVNTEEQAVALYRPLTEVFAKGGFRLNKWISNNLTLLSAISEENRAKGVNQLDLSRDQLPMERTLSVQWNM